MAHIVESHSNTAATALRDDINRAERLVVSIRRENVESLLVLLDDIDAKFDDLSASAIDLRPELGRWNSLKSRMVTHAGAVSSAAGRAGGMPSLRAKHPPAVNFWWHLDAEVGRRRRRSFARLGAGLAAIAAAIALLFWILNTFFPPDPNTMFVLGATSQVDSLVMSGDWEEALKVIEVALESLPDDPELLIWEAVLSEELGQDERAETSLAKAEASFDGNPTFFWVTVGNKRLQVGNVDSAAEAAAIAQEIDPDAPQAVFLAANVAEANGDRLTAIDLYNRTFELAEEFDPQLAVIAKVRMGQLLQQVDPFADVATPTPEAIPGS